MTRFDFSPCFRTLLDFALTLRLVDGVGIAAMAVAPKVSGRQLENFMLAEIDDASEARMHDQPEIRRIWFVVRSRCKAIEQDGQRTGRAGIDSFRCDERLSELWREARIEAI